MRRTLNQPGKTVFGDELVQLRLIGENDLLSRSKSIIDNELTMPLQASANESARMAELPAISSIAQAKYSAPVASNSLAEAPYYATIDAIQQILAKNAVQFGYSPATVPTWTIQVIVFLAACHQRLVPQTDISTFRALARWAADYGSRIFPDTNLWPANPQAIQVCVRLVERYDLTDLLVLLGRALDYGRTVIWSTEGGQLVRSRDLVVAKSQGVFYTPLFVARHLARRCLTPLMEERAPTVCDPSAGGGVLLLAAAETLLERYAPDQVLISLYGSDTDPIAVEVAALVVSSLCGAWNLSAAPPPLNTTIINGDAFGGPLYPTLIDTAPGAICWARAFPEQFNDSKDGFDVVLTNPPFGRYKVDSDWLIARDMRLDPDSLNALRSAGHQRSQTLRSSGYYALSMNGVLDKSRIGLERAMQLTRSGGRLGAIIPSTINADTASFAIRRNLLYHWELTEVDEFPETAHLFYDVNQSISVLVAGKGTATTVVNVRSSVYKAEDLARPFSAKWPLDTIERLSPKLAIPVRLDNVEGVLEQIHRHPRLAELPGIVNARGEIDVSAFKNYITDDPSMTPLVRGAQIDCYRTDIPSLKAAYIDTEALFTRLARSPKLRHFHRSRVVGRQCSYLYRSQRLSFALVEPERAIANSCNYLSVDDNAMQFYLLAVLNSTLMNWRFKLFNSNNHVSNTEIDELPIPNPTAIPASLYYAVVELAQQLCQGGDDSLVAKLDDHIFDIYGLHPQQRRDILGDTVRRVREEGASVAL